MFLRLECVECSQSNVLMLHAPSSYQVFARYKVISLLVLLKTKSSALLMMASRVFAKSVMTHAT